MKIIKVFLIAVFAVFLNLGVIAQTASKKTENIKVLGNCGSCKARIEKTAKAAGAQTAVWNMDSKILTVVYDPAKVNVADIEKKLAAVGHETASLPADSKAYDALPGCCKYDRQK